MTLIDKDFLKKEVPDAIMKKMESPIYVKNIRPRKHSSVDYATIDICFPGNKHCTVAIHQEVHVIDSFKAKMLIGINILRKKSFTINIENKKATIRNCNNIVFPLKVAH